MTMGFHVVGEGASLGHDGAQPAARYSAVPTSELDKVPPGEATIDSDAFFGPEVNGANCNVTGQLLPASTLPQPFAVITKSAAFGPTIWLPTRPEGPLPVFHTSNACVCPPLPVTAVPKSCDGGSKVSAAGPPGPEILLVEVPPGDALTVTVAYFHPSLVGAKCMVAWHSPRPAKGAVHVEVSMTNWVASGPPTVIVGRPVGDVPMFPT